MPARRKLLLTGASGLLGLNAALQLSASYEVVGVVNAHPFKSSLFKVVQKNLLEDGAVESLIEEIQPHWIFNCAALADVDQCEKFPQLAQRLNVELPSKLAKEAARHRIVLVHISSDTVFDGQKGNYSEEDLPNPISVYAKSKLMGEYAVSEILPTALIARTNLIGWGRSAKRSLAEFFFYNLRDGIRVNGFRDVYFCPLLANTLAEIISRLVELEAQGLYHVFSKDAMNKYDFGVQLARRFGFDEALITPLSVEEPGLTAQRTPNLTMDTTKLQKTLGMTLPSVRDALEGFYQQYLQGYPRYLQNDVID